MMLYVGLIIIGCCALGFLLGVHLWFWSRYYADAQPRYDEQHFARTRDNERLALWRYRPEKLAAAQPILLCHGGFTNGRIFDLCPEASLARYLRDRGFDVWILDLRGASASRRAGFVKQAPATILSHLRDDFPAAIEYICTHTQSPALHWVGHSLGGLLGLLYAQTRGVSRVRSLCTLGSPSFLAPAETLRVNASMLRLSAALLLPFVPILARFLAPLYVGIRVHMLAINGANIEPYVVRLALSRCIDQVSYPVFRQLLAWARSSSLSLGEWDFRAGLSTVKTPLLSIVGTADPLCTVTDARELAERLTCPHELRILGRDFDCERDYGHGDFLLGRRAAQECFAHIAAFVAQRSLDALPVPMPEQPLSLEPSVKLDAGQSFDAEPLILSAPPAIPGPYGLLVRYSPFRRRRWLKARKELRQRLASGATKSTRLRTLQRPKP